MGKNFVKSNSRKDENNPQSSRLEFIRASVVQPAEGLAPLKGAESRISLKPFEHHGNIKPRVFREPLKLSSIHDENLPNVENFNVTLLYISNTIFLGMSD